MAPRLDCNNGAELSDVPPPPLAPWTISVSPQKWMPAEKTSR